MRLSQWISQQVRNRHRLQRRYLNQKRRQLLFEQFEDRRVLALAVDDAYLVNRNTMLTVQGLGTWSNDTYNSSWPETYCDGGVWHDGYWEYAVWYEGYYDENSEWQPGYLDPPEDVWHDVYCQGGTAITVTQHAGSWIVSGPQHGTLNLIDTGNTWADDEDEGQYGLAFEYTPSSDFSGTDSFTYGLSDNEGNSTAVVTIVVDDPPVAGNDQFVTDVNSTLTVTSGVCLGIFANDHDVENGDISAASLVANPSHGSLTFSTDGNFVYAPSPNYHGTDSFTYSVTDGLHTSTATVSLLIDSAPEAIGDPYEVNEDTLLTVDAENGVLANDGDLEGDPIAIALDSGPSHGTVALSANGSFTYLPFEDYSGTDSFTYSASDGLLASTAIVTITVNPVNDAPVAANNAYIVLEDFPRTVGIGNGVMANDSDVDGDLLTPALVTGPAHGTLTLGSSGNFTYSPSSNYSGTDSFTYRASDGQVSSGIATVTLSVVISGGEYEEENHDFTITVGNEGRLPMEPIPGIDENHSLGLFGFNRQDNNDFGFQFDDTLTIFYTLEGTLGPNGELPASFNDFTDDGYGIYELQPGVTLNYGGYLALFDNIPEGTEALKVTIVGYSSSLHYDYEFGPPNSWAYLYIKDNDRTLGAKPVLDKTKPCDCPCTCETVATAYNMNNGAAYATSSAAGLKYDSNGAQPRAILQADVKFGAGYGEGDTVAADFSFNGELLPSQSYSLAGIDSDKTYRMGAIVAGDNLETGYYSWSADLSATADDITVPTEADAFGIVRNYQDSEFGPGWIATGIDKLKVQLEGVLWLRGDANAFFFTGNGSSFTRDAADSDFSELTQDGGGYTLHKKTGETLHFTDDGVMTTRTDRTGNVMTYTYVDADDDDLEDEISTITDPSGRVTTYGYTGQWVTSITDTYGRVTTLVHDEDGRLMEVLEPDPDGAGILPAPHSDFTYNSNSFLLHTVTDAENNTTSFGYGGDNDDAQFVTSVTHPGGGSESLTAQLFAALDGGSGDLVELDDVKATYTNEVEKSWEFVFNIFGGPVTVKPLFADTPDDYTSTYHYYNEDALGQFQTNLLIQQIDPIPGFGGPTEHAITNYGYDSKGNLTGIEYPDLTTRSWTYDSTFSQPTSYTDARNKTTIFTVSPTNGNITRVRQINGASDLSTSETDDIVTDYTYTPLTTDLMNDRPAGLIASVLNPRLYLTTYGYSGRGLLDTVTYAVGTADEAAVSFHYDTFENLDYSLDELTRRTDYTFDRLDRLTSMTLPDPDGTGTTGLLSRPAYVYKYDRNNRLKTLTDPANVTTYEYSGRGDLTDVHVFDDEGEEELAHTIYGYDDHRRLTSVTDPLTHVTSYRYDGFDQNTSITLPDPNPEDELPAPVLDMLYDRIGRLVDSSDGRGKHTVYNFADWFSIPTTLPDPDGPSGPLNSPVFINQFDEEGNLVYATDPNDPNIDPVLNDTTYEYDDVGRLTLRRDPNPDDGSTNGGPEWIYQYDKNGNLAFVTDPLGHVTEYRYDARDRLVRVIQPDPDGVAGPQESPETIYAYNDAGEMTSMTDFLQNVTTVYGHDFLGRLTSVTQPDPDGGGDLESPVTLYAYNNHLQLSDVTDPEGRVTSYEYDGLGYTHKVTSNDPGDYQYSPGLQGRPYTIYVYDAVGNLQSVTDPLGHTKTYDYDDLDRRTEITDAEGKHTFFTYDNNGNMRTLTDPENNTTTWAYDYLNRATSETNQLEKTRHFEYDAVGNLTKKTDRNDRVTVYAYDHLNRFTDEYWLDAEEDVTHTISYAYDAASRLTGATDSVAGSYGYEYDDLDRLTTETQDITGLAEIQYVSQYNSASSRTQLQAKIDGTNDFHNTYDYDHLQRLTSLKQQGVSGGNDVAQKRADFSYKADGQFDVITRYEDVAGVYPVVETSYFYDGMGRAYGIQNYGPNMATWIRNFFYQYDAASRITNIYDQLGNSSLNATISYYEYDDTNQLTSVSNHYNNSPDQLFSYDDNGNPVAVVSWPGESNEYTETYTIDDDNHLTGGLYQYTYDDEGNRITKDGDIQYVWDNRNRLVEVLYWTGGESPQVAGSVTYTYDPFNRLVHREYTGRHPNDWTITDHDEEFFSYENNQIVLQFNGGDASDLTQRYLWGPDVDHLLIVENINWSASAYVIQFPITDIQNTVQSLYADIWQGLDNVWYSAFGAMTGGSSNPNGFTNPDFMFGFTGRLFDTTTGLQYNTNRWYDPATRRWMSEDPIGFAGGDANLYRYVGNDPVSHVDPSGFGKIKVIIKLGNSVSKVMWKSKEDLIRMLRKRVADAKLPISQRKYTGRVFVQCENDAAAKKLAEAVSPEGTSVKHALSQAGHPPHYHPVKGYSPSGRPQTDGTPHIGSEYEGSPNSTIPPIIPIPLGQNDDEEATRLLQAGGELIIDLSPIGDAKDVADIAKYLVGDIVVMAADECQRMIILENASREMGIGRLSDRKYTPVGPLTWWSSRKLTP